MGLRRRGRVLVRGALALAGALLAVGLAHAPRADATAHLVLRSGPLTATVQLDPFSITVAERGAVVLSTASAGRLPVGDRGPLSFALGARVAAQPPLMGYGLIADVPLTWFHATRAERRPDGSLLVHTTDPTRSFALRLRSAGDGIVEVDARLSNPDGVLLTGASFLRDSDERFVGFGERSDRVEQSGQVVEQWNEEGPFSAGCCDRRPIRSSARPGRARPRWAPRATSRCRGWCRAGASGSSSTRPG